MGPILATAGLFLAAEGSAFALCPNCLGQSPETSPTMRLVGLFLIVPPIIFFAVAGAIKRASRGTHD